MWPESCVGHFYSTGPLWRMTHLNSATFSCCPALLGHSCSALPSTVLANKMPIEGWALVLCKVSLSCSLVVVAISEAHRRALGQLGSFHSTGL